jgi:hypothetical protein
MKYKVIPFHPTITDKGGAEQASMELEKIIEEKSLEGWNFVSLESMTTTVRPTGCASLSSKNEVKSIQMIVFSK